MLSYKYTQILKRLTPFVICPGFNLANYNFDYWGHDRKDFFICDPLKLGSDVFFNLVKAVDHLSFGEQGMGMDNWVMFDCGAMPSGIVGFCLPQEEVPSQLAEKMQIPKHYKGPIPISFFIAIPTVRSDHWFGHNLSSLGNKFGLNFSGLGILTKALGIKMMNIKYLYGATQWGNGAINVHVQLAPMEIMSSYTPVHSYPNTICYQSNYPVESLDEFSLSGVARKATEHDISLKADDLRGMRELQSKIEAGHRYIIAGRPWMDENNRPVYPIQKLH